MTRPQTVIHGGCEYLSPGINYARCLCERKEKATKPRPRRQIKRCGGLIVNETTKFLERVASPLVTGAMFSWCNCGLFGTAIRSRDNLQWLSVWWDIIHPAPFSSSYKYSLSAAASVTNEWYANSIPGLNQMPRRHREGVADLLSCSSVPCLWTSTYRSPLKH